MYENNYRNKIDLLFPAVLSELVYLDDRDYMEEKLASMGWELVTVLSFKSTGTYIIVIKKKDFLFVIGRGTEITSIRDIKTDIQIVPIVTDTFEGRVHKGFYSSFSDAILAVKKILIEQAEKEPYLKIYFTGHSLGAALVSLLYVNLHNYSVLRPFLKKCITFGCPKIGDKKFSMNNNFAPDDLIRVVNFNDIVPRRPKLFRLIFGYRHCGIEYYLDRKHVMHIVPSWKKKCCLTIRGIFSRGFIFACVKNHSMAEYIKSITS